MHTRFVSEHQTNGRPSRCGYAELSKRPTVAAARLDDIRLRLSECKILPLYASATRVIFLYWVNFLT